MAEDQLDPSLQINEDAQDASTATLDPDGTDFFPDSFDDFPVEDSFETPQEVLETVQINEPETEQEDPSVYDGSASNKHYNDVTSGADSDGEKISGVSAADPNRPYELLKERRESASRYLTQSLALQIALERLEWLYKQRDLLQSQIDQGLAELSEHLGVQITSIEELETAIQGMEQELQDKHEELCDHRDELEEVKQQIAEEEQLIAESKTGIVHAAYSLLRAKERLQNTSGDYSDQFDNLDQAKAELDSGGIITVDVWYRDYEDFEFLTNNGGTHVVMQDEQGRYYFQAEGDEPRYITDEHLIAKIEEQVAQGKILGNDPEADASLVANYEAAQREMNLAQQAIDMSAEALGEAERALNNAEAEMLEAQERLTALRERKEHLEEHIEKLKAEISEDESKLGLAQNIQEWMEQQERLDALIEQQERLVEFLEARNELYSDPEYRDLLNAYLSDANTVNTDALTLYIAQNHPRHLEAFREIVGDQFAGDLQRMAAEDGLSTEQIAALMASLQESQEAMENLREAQAVIAEHSDMSRIEFLHTKLETWSLGEGSMFRAMTDPLKDSEGRLVHCEEDGNRLYYVEKIEGSEGIRRVYYDETDPIQSANLIHQAWVGNPPKLFANETFLNEDPENTYIKDQFGFQKIGEGRWKACTDKTCVIIEDKQGSDERQLGKSATLPTKKLEETAEIDHAATIAMANEHDGHSHAQDQDHGAEEPIEEPAADTNETETHVETVAETEIHEVSHLTMEKPEDQMQLNDVLQNIASLAASGSHIYKEVLEAHIDTLRDVLSDTVYNAVVAQVENGYVQHALGLNIVIAPPSVFDPQSPGPLQIVAEPDLDNIDVISGEIARGAAADDIDPNPDAIDLVNTFEEANNNNVANNPAPAMELAVKPEQNNNMNMGTGGGGSMV